MMDLWLCFCWTSLLLRRAWSAPEPAPRYHLQPAELPFHQANAACSNGSLTTLRSEREAQQLLQLLPAAGPGHRTVFWVGLEKVKSECVIRALPLRGFKWVADGSEETQVSRWLEEPKDTCTRQCAALALDGSRWGLVPASCRSRHQSICKLEGAQQLQGTEHLEPGEQTPGGKMPGEQMLSELTPGGKTAGGKTPGEPTPGEQTPGEETPGEQTPGEPTPAAPGAEPTRVGRVQPGSSPEPPAASPGPRLTSPEEPEASTALTLSEPELPLESSGPRAAPGSRACSTPEVRRTRSLSLDPQDVNRVLLECWSGVTLLLVCSGRPAAWRLLDNSTLDGATVCQRCSPAFQGKCRHSCRDLNGTCVCLDQDGHAHQEAWQKCSSAGEQNWITRILLPALLAALLLVVLLVVAVTVRCCLKRRARRRAMEKGTFETANETTA